MSIEVPIVVWNSLSNTTFQGMEHQDSVHETAPRCIRPDEKRVLCANGIERNRLKFKDVCVTGQIPPFPDTYTNLTPVVLKKDHPTISDLDGSINVDMNTLERAIEDEKKWNSKTREILSKDIQNNDDPIPWAAFHADAHQDQSVDVTMSTFNTFVS